MGVFFYSKAMSKKNDEIIKICEETAVSEGFLPVETVIRGSKNQLIIEVFIDSENPVTIDDCAALSTKINTIFEENAVIDGNYRLDVSSPGTDRPLRYLQQFPKNTGRLFDIEYTENGETKKLSGKLLGVEGSKLKFAVRKEEIELEHGQIIKAIVKISFS